MLDSVGRVLETDEDRDHEVFASGGQGAERIFHVCSAGLVDYLEITWSIGLEEGSEQLRCLVAAAVAGTGEDRDLKIVGEPCGKLVGVSGCNIFCDRIEHVISFFLRRKPCAGEYRNQSKSRVIC